MYNGAVKAATDAHPVHPTHVRAHKTLSTFKIAGKYREQDVMRSFSNPVHRVQHAISVAVPLYVVRPNVLHPVLWARSSAHKVPLRLFCCDVNAISRQAAHPFKHIAYVNLDKSAMLHRVSVHPVRSASPTFPTIRSVVWDKLFTGSITVEKRDSK